MLETITDSLAFTGGVRVLIAAIIGVTLGLERGLSNKDAGPRTYALVASGSALFTILSMEAFNAPDPSRVAAQIVTGIGFLGAGLIFREGMSVHGLTTAAGLWSVAAMGMAAGTGHFGLAIVVGVIVLIVLRGSHRLSKRFKPRTLRGADWRVRLTVADLEAIEDIKALAAGFAPSAAKPLPDIGHWKVGQKKGNPTITLLLTDSESQQLMPMFESHDGISKIRVQSTS